MLIIHTTVSVSIFITKDTVINKFKNTCETLHFDSWDSDLKGN